MLEELEEPETASTTAPAAGLWVRVKQWYRNRGYLLAWVLAAWGVWNLVDLAVLAANTYQQAQDLENFAWVKYVQMVYIPTMIPHVLLILVSVILVFRGRQLAGRLRWYHLGWLLVLMGLLNMRLPLPAPLRFLQTGPVWSISTALLVYLAEYGPENMWEFVSYLPDPGRRLLIRLRTYLSGWMNVVQLLDFFCDFYPDFDRDAAEHMLTALEISPKLRIRQMSKGTREKVQLILVMSRRARLYLLDEPIGGVDPATRDYIIHTILSNYNENRRRGPRHPGLHPLHHLPW